MSQNYTISDIFNYSYSGPVSTTATGGSAVAEVFTITTTGGFAGITGGQYFIVYTANDATKYYVWFDVTGSNTDPAIPGATGIEVDWTAHSVTNDASLATAIGARLDAADANFGTPSVLGNVVTVTLQTTGHTTDVNATTATHLPPTGIAVAVTQQGSSAAAANTGLMYRDTANNDEVRVLGAGTTGHVLTTTASNTIGWQAPVGVSSGTTFLVRPSAVQAINSTALTSFTTLNWATETLDSGANFASPVYTIPSTGIYYFQATIEWATSAKNNKGERHVEIAEDPGGGGESVLILKKEQVNPDKTIAFFQSLGIIYSATAAETIGVRVSQDSTIVSNIGTESRFFGWRII